MAKIRSTQVFDVAKNATLDAILAALTIAASAKSLTFPDGTILKWGDTGAFASVGANAVATGTVVFPVQFPTACEFFHAILTPATSTDFYGVTSLVDKSATQARFTYKNGATAQVISGGIWIALGR